MSVFGKHLKYFVYFSIIVCFISCKQTKSSLSEYGVVFEKVVLSEQGVFRGFSMGDSLKKIESAELQQPKEKEDNYLYYEYKIDSLTTFNVSYSFDDRGLNEIKSDIFIKSSTDKAEETFDKFKEYFDEHYGESDTQGGFNVWSVKSEKYGEVKIDLSNEFPAFNSPNSIGKISIWIYPDNY